MKKISYDKMLYIPCDLDHLRIMLLDQGKQGLHCFASVNYILK